MSKFNVTLLPVIAVKMVDVDAENAAHAVQVARTILGTPPFYWMERDGPAPGVAMTYDNEEMPYVMVDALKDGADARHHVHEEIVARTDWFMADVPHDMAELLSAAWAVVQQTEAAAVREAIAGTPMAAAVHNLRVVLDSIPPVLPELPPKLDGPDALFK